MHMITKISLITVIKIARILPHKGKEMGYTISPGNNLSRACTKLSVHTCLSLQAACRSQSWTRLEGLKLSLMSFPAVSTYT